MGTLKIGIFDEEERYVQKLAAYLNRHGWENWNMCSFTDEKILSDYMERQELDILAGTRKEVLMNLQQNFGRTCYIWLTENNLYKEDKEKKLYTIYRYQSAKAVAKAMKDIVDYLGLLKGIHQKIIAIYSPVGRCGKTSLALEFVKSGRCGRWMYIGMEDYSFLESSNIGDSELFLYFVKERNREKVKDLIEAAQGVLPSAFSPFDTRQVGKADIQWLLEMLQENHVYNGIVFDIGTGVLQDFESFLLFDVIVVPYLPDDKSMEKRKQFESLVIAYDLEEVVGKLRFINMKEKNQIMHQIEEIVNE